MSNKELSNEADEVMQLEPRREANEIVVTSQDDTTNAATAAGEDHSVLSVSQKKVVIAAASFATIFGPMATAIYCKPTSFIDWMQLTSQTHPSIQSPRILALAIPKSTSLSQSSW